MARRIQSQITREPAVRPVAPVAPTGIADIGQLIAGITQAGTTLAQTQGRAFQQERQVGAIERQADAAEARIEQAQVDQDTLELQIESNQNRLLTTEAKTEMARLVRLERLGIQAIVDETPVDELPALYAEIPKLNPANQDAFARLIGARTATADETNLLKRLGELQLARQQVDPDLEGPPLPIDQSVSGVVLELTEERAFDDPLIAAVHEQQLTSVANSWMRQLVLKHQKLQSDELANSAADEFHNVTFRALEAVFVGDQDASSIRELADNTFPVVNAAIPSHDKTEHLDTLAAIVTDWAKSAPDLERALAVVSEISNLGEQYQRRLRGLKADLTDAVKRQAITRESTRVANIRQVAELKIVEFGTEGSQSPGRLADLRKAIEGLDLPDVEVIKLLSRADKEIAQLARSRGEQVQLDRILAGESFGMVSANATATWYKNHPEISIEGRLALLASKGQLLPRVAARDVEELAIQAPAEAIGALRALEEVSRNATGALIGQMQVPGRTRALLNSTRGLSEDDPLFKQITDSFAAPGAFQLYLGAVKQLGGELPVMTDPETGEQIIFQIDDAKFPQNRLIERFLLSPGTQIDPSVLEDFSDSFIAGWLIGNDDVTFGGAHPRDKVEFARSYAVKAIERRYALVGQRDGTRQFVRRDLLGDPTDEEVHAISRRMHFALQDQELDFGRELSIAWDAIQPIGKTSLVPIGGIAVTEDSEGPQFVAFIELDHATGLTRTVSAITDPVGFDEARLLMGDASKRLDPTVRLNWTSDKGSAVAGQNPDFLAVIGPDMLREGEKAWRELVGGRPDTRPGDFGIFMDDFLRTHNWSGPFPRPLLLRTTSSGSLTGITLFGAGRIPGMQIAGSTPQLGNQLSQAATPREFDVEPGTDISLVPAAMREIMDSANGDPDLAAKLARDAGWLVPEIDN